ncbi:hypothetical protein SK128_024258 [Halocaridina rubra]|uniref:Uncharacterized protein n=1 Tax=Halocaridina rubra TaxID=373956 RepID=A0AAN9A2K7_HALRR
MTKIYKLSLYIRLLPYLQPIHSQSCRESRDSITKLLKNHGDKLNSLNQESEHDEDIYRFTKIYDK